MRAPTKEQPSELRREVRSSMRNEQARRCAMNASRPNDIGVGYLRRCNLQSIIPNASMASSAFMHQVGKMHFGGSSAQTLAAPSCVPSWGNYSRGAFRFKFRKNGSRSQNPIRHAARSTSHSSMKFTIMARCIASLQAFRQREEPIHSKAKRSRASPLFCGAMPIQVIGERHPTRLQSTSATPRFLSNLALGIFPK